MSKNVLDAIISMETTQADLLDTISALQVLEEGLDRDGYQTEANFQEWRAVNFSRRFPMYLNTYRMLCRNLQRISDELHKDVESAYRAALREGAAV